MSKDSGSGSDGLLSRMVKFVKSPATNWSDLDRRSGSSGDSESRMALKEMIERKRRNDFVRNREFDMLRKVRRRENLKDSDVAIGGPSFAPSSQTANTGERARTLKKIDEIEAQMSTAWFKGNDKGVAPQARPALPAQAPGQPPRRGPAYDKTVPMTLPPGERPTLPPGERPTLPPAAAFAPTLTLAQTVPAPVAPTAAVPAVGKKASPPAQVTAAKAPPAAKPAAQAPAAAVAPAVVPAKRLLGDVPEFNVEVMAAAKQDPEVEEAAIRFANGDTAGAEAVLLDLLAVGGTHRNNVDTWLTLFDLYRCANESTKFDDAALDFAAIFGRSAPQWALVTELGSFPEPVAAQPVAVTAGVFHWACPSVMGVQSVAALKMTLARHVPPWRIDWRHLKTIEPAALPALTDVLKEWADSPARVKFLGVERLLEVLIEHSPTDDREADPQWWVARLALLRLMDDMDEFEMVALNYCVTYEVSPPAWETPKSSYSAMNEEGVTLQPSQFDADDMGEPSRSFALSESPISAAAALDNGLYKGKLEGEHIGSMDDALQAFVKASGVFTGFEINCRKLLRVDFGAAGDLLNWCMEQQGKGQTVTLKQVNRLLAAFFGVIGITESARVMLRTD
ncbi:MAG: hypothetical protein Q4G70_15055 [Pseudomonadota bacterium]|nr:hypothetical protein [Pseudomonadota bacterium]